MQSKCLIVEASNIQITKIILCNSLAVSKTTKTIENHLKSESEWLACQTVTVCMTVNFPTTDRVTYFITIQ